MSNKNILKINKSKKYTWKIFKPLIPLIFLGIWANIFEDTIWKNYKKEKPIAYFKNSDLQWEFEMDERVAKDKYQFNIIQYSGQLDMIKMDTIYIDKTLMCILSKDDSTNLNLLIGEIITAKGRVINYNKRNKMIKLDNCYIQ